jgi:hypothetical protein
MAQRVAPVSGVVGGVVRSSRSAVGAVAVASSEVSVFGLDGELTARLLRARDELKYPESIGAAWTGVWISRDTRTVTRASKVTMSLFMTIDSRGRVNT